MAETPDVRFTGVLAGTDFERLLAVAVADQVAISIRQSDGPMAGLLKEVHDHRERSFTEWQTAKLEIEKIRDAYKAREDQATSDIKSANEYLEMKVDALKEKMNKQANTIFLPVASIVLLAGLIGLWVLVGSMSSNSENRSMTASARLPISMRRLARHSETSPRHKRHLILTNKLTKRSRGRSQRISRTS